jgi:hypothetical protein
MFDEESDQRPDEVARTPAERAREKSDEFRTHAERAAVFEAVRKFDARLLPTLAADLARDVQRTIARLEKSKSPDSPILPDASAADAARLLDLPNTGGPSTNDYHVHRRPGEVMIVRWLEGGQVDTFYERFQAHFNVALEGFREDERQARAWKQDPATLAYLEALDAIDVKLADRYLRDPIRQHKLFVLSTQTADEMDILHLTDYLMGVAPGDLVGAAAAPPADGPTERDRAWFFKLFALRGVKDAGVEQMCFFTFLQKTEDTFDFE